MPPPKAAAPDDGLGGSLDPLVGKGKGGAAPGTETAPLGALPGDDPSLAETRPLDLQYDPNAAKPANGDAAAQYKAGYDAIVHGDYAFAEDQFKQFLAAYPDDPQAADATNWLGEALLQRQDYVDAADTLVNGYKKYQDSPRAPDMLLNLGIAFAGAKQPEASCKTFTLLQHTFSKSDAGVQDSAREGNGQGQMHRLMEQAALAALFRPLIGNRSVGLAVSGGPDSLALMVMAAQWGASAGGCAAVDRLLSRPRAAPGGASEAALVMHEAAKLGLPARTLRWDRSQATGRAAAGSPCGPLWPDRRCDAGGSGHYSGDRAPS